jgi:NAD(P)-dependent dehydrogenase (short-subunit alcohol dehydrogenase family)
LNLLEGFTLSILPPFEKYHIPVPKSFENFNSRTIPNITMDTKEASQPYKTPTAYPKTELVPQDQEGGKGLDANLEAQANWTQLEFWDDEGTKPFLQDYEGRGLLKDKAVLITGGDSGIGRSVGVLMAREGADISFVYLPEEEQDAQDTKKMIEKAGHKANLIALDVTKEENCQKIVDSHMKEFGKLSVLVNNAAMQEMCDDLKDINLDVVEKTFRTNILSMFAMTKFALPHMKRGSSIVNSCSVAAYMGNPQLVDYSSTKGAISTFTRALAQQQAPKGIRVNAVAPGIIWTPLQPATKGNAAENMDSLGVEAAPLQRPGMPIEVATAYVFLASPLGSYFAGEVIHGTGGIEMQG